VLSPVASRFAMPYRVSICLGSVAPASRLPYPVFRCGTGRFRTFESLGCGLRESPCANLDRDRGIAPGAPPPPPPAPDKKEAVLFFLVHRQEARGPDT
jgi:hypothetical protein